MHREQPAGTAPAPALHHAEAARTPQQGCSKNLVKWGYRRHSLGSAADPVSNEIALEALAFRMRR